MMLQGNC